MRKVFVILITVLVAAVGSFATGQTEAAAPVKEVQLNWAAAGVTGTYYPLSVGMANIINKYYPEIKITIETTGGGVENARLVGAGDNDIGLANSNYCLFALQGVEPYKQAYKLHSVAYLYPTAMHFIVKADSPIRSIADMKGRKVAVGPAGGGTIQVLRDMLPFYGLQESDLRLSYISFADGSNALRDGNVDVNMVIAGPPATAAKELAETVKVRFIPVEREIIKKMYDKYGYYVPVVFPKAMYNTPEDVLTIGGGVQWIVRDGLDADVVYKMTKAVFDHLPEAAAIHPIAQYIKPADAIQVSVPLHPGAEKYFREAGVIK